MIIFLTYNGNNNVTLIESDIVKAVIINPDKNAFLLFSILCILATTLSFFTNEKFLSKANNHQTKNIIHIINIFIFHGIWNFIQFETKETKSLNPNQLLNDQTIFNAKLSNIDNFINAKTKLAENNVTENVTKNCITVTHKALLRDLHFININKPVISNTELTHHLVPITIAIKFFAGILSDSQRPIKAHAIGEPDIVISVIKYDKKKDLTGDHKNFTKYIGLKALIIEYFNKSNPTNNINKEKIIRNILIIIFTIFFSKNLFIIVSNLCLSKLCLSKL